MSDVSGAEYLQRVLGDVLAKALASVAKERPDDPVNFVAEYLYKVRREQKLDEAKSFDLAASEEGSTKSRDSGLYDDQEAPVSNDTLTTVELKDKLSRHEDRSKDFDHHHDKDSDGHGQRGRSKSLNGGVSSSSSTNTNGSDNNNRGDRHGASSSSRGGQDDSLLGTADSDRRQRSRRRNRSDRRNNRTAQSEPISASTTSLIYSNSSSNSGGYNNKRRSRSVNTGYTNSSSNSSSTGRSGRKSVRKIDPSDPSTYFSKKTPMAALPNDEYRKQRGLAARNLPPMSQTPRVEREMPDGRQHLTYSINGKSKPRQLQPLIDGWQDSFDWQRHERRNRKIMKESKIVANMV